MDELGEDIFVSDKVEFSSIVKATVSNSNAVRGEKNEPKHSGYFVTML